MRKLAFIICFALAIGLIFGWLPSCVRNDSVPQGFTFSGQGSLSWEESTKTLTVYQETEKLTLEISEPEIPRIVHRNKIPGGKLLLKVSNGNPTKIYGLLSTSSGSVMIINRNGLLVGSDAVIDLEAGDLSLSTLDVDQNDFANSGDDRFQKDPISNITDFGVLEINGEEIVLGNFLFPPSSRLEGELIIYDKPKVPESTK